MINREYRFTSIILKTVQEAAELESGINLRLRQGRELFHVVDHDMHEPEVVIRELGIQ